MKVQFCDREKLEFIKFINTIFYLIRTAPLKVQMCNLRNVQAFFNK